VAIPVSVAGDLVIRPEFVRFVEAIAGPCGDNASPTPLASPIVASLTGGGKLASGRAFPAREDLASPLAPWLFGIAMAAAIGELFARRMARGRNPTSRVPADHRVRQAAATGATS